MKQVLEYLAKAEGTDIVYLQNEKDITAPYGIYRHAHPDAEIFKFIDSVARSIGIEHKSNQWDIGKVKRVNTALVGMQDEIDKLVSEFYEEYLKPAHLELFPPLCRVAMFSMYTNSPKNAWKSVQQSLIDVDKNNLGNNDDLSIVDGSFGRKTERGIIDVVQSLNKQGHLYFETLMLSNMKTLYIRLAMSNPDKYLKYLKGWDNRMNLLAKM